MLLIVGVAISAFPSEESHVETISEKIGTSTFTRTLPAQNTTWVATLMETGMWFQLNITSSDSVSVTMSVLIAQEPEPIWGATGSSFDQKLSVPGTGTYVIEVANENPFPVALDGNVIKQQYETNYSTVFPYFLPGLLIALGGAAALLFGILRKPTRTARTAK
jgi:hypothetical protein